MTAATMAGSVRCAMWACPSSIRTRASGIAASAVGRLPQHHRALGAGQQQRRRGDAVDRAGAVDPILLRPRLPDDRGRRRHTDQPLRPGAHEVDLLVGEVEQIAEHHHTQLVAVAGRLDLLGPVDPAGPVAEPETRLVEHQMTDPGGQRRAAHRATRPEGVAPQHHRTSRPLRDRVHHHRHVGRLRVEGVRCPVAARAEAATVHRHRRESARSSDTRAREIVWSWRDPWTSTSGGPSPSTHTARSTPSGERTVNRPPTEASIPVMTGLRSGPRQSPPARRRTAPGG